MEDPTNEDIKKYANTRILMLLSLYYISNNDSIMVIFKNIDWLYVFAVVIFLNNVLDSLSNYL